MRWNPGCKISVGAVALLSVVGTAAAVGISVAPGTATAAPANLIQNGSFENTTKQTTTFLPVYSGDSTTITDWTVATPSIYEGRGSVDLTSKKYFNAEKGKYSIDLAGSSKVPGGIYQDVTTTPGEEYSLSFWSGVNGQEKKGISHTTDVSVNGSSLDQVNAVSAGLPVQWVQNTATFTATSTTSQIEFDDATPMDKNQGPTIDNVSLVAEPDAISASSVTIPDQTTGDAFTTPVATFTDSYPGAPTSDFAANITWGDGGSGTGSISVSGSTYTVSGTYTYAAHGSYTVDVAISSVAEGTASVSDSVNVADNVAGCTGEGCSGTVNDPDETVQIDSTSTSGTIDTSTDPADTGPDCGDPFRHSPDVVTVTDEGLNANIVFTVTFDNASAGGSWFVPFAVCYESQTPFTDLFGNTNVTTGLLPMCATSGPVVAPCVESIVESPDPLGNPADTGNVVETIVVPPGDPKFH